MHAPILTTSNIELRLLKSRLLRKMNSKSCLRITKNVVCWESEPLGTAYWLFIADAAGSCEQDPNVWDSTRLQSQSGSDPHIPAKCGRDSLSTRIQLDQLLDCRLG